MEERRTKKILASATTIKIIINEYLLLLKKKKEKKEEIIYIEEEKGEAILREPYQTTFASTQYASRERQTLFERRSHNISRREIYRVTS